MPPSWEARCWGAGGPRLQSWALPPRPQTLTGPGQDAEAAEQLMQSSGVHPCLPGPPDTWPGSSRAQAALVAAPPHSRVAFPCPSCFGSRWNACGDLPSCGCCRVSPQLSDRSLSLAYVSVISSGSVLWWPCLRSGGMGSVGEEACGPRADTAQAKPTRGPHLPAPRTHRQGLRATVHLSEPGCHRGTTLTTARALLGVGG